MEQIIEGIFNYGPTLVTLASIVTATTPTPKDEGVLRGAYRIIESLALVVGRAKEGNK
ncbi:hypothetical protein [Magnetococcus marinus]|uniref:hypothetical protein n=1 Tax=Magnetococcus marinus TaxID=1124597 RepID=UPI00003C5B12|nr:hypothetical protein [Magnetococcus marinus]